MIKDLIVTGIPKDSGTLKKVLKVIGDTSWTAEAVEAWVDDLTLKYIWFDPKYNTYVMGAKVPSLNCVNIKNYKEVIEYEK